MADTPAAGLAAVQIDALIAVHAHDCRDNLFGGQVGSLAPNTTEVVRAVLEAALPHLLADRDTETARLREEIAYLRGLAILEHTHIEACAHEVRPTEVEGVSECSYCGPSYGATEFCPNQCDFVRIEHDHATSLRGEQA